MRVVASRSLVLLTPVFAGACELREISITEPEDVLIAEVYAQVGVNANRVAAFIHGTLAELPPQVTIQIVANGRDTLRFDERGQEGCTVGPIPESTVGRCYLAEPSAESLLRPGDTLSLVIVASDGRRLSGRTVVPGSFRVLHPARTAQVCAAPANESLDVTWTRSEGAWAYISEASIRGLSEVFDTASPPVEDPLLLLGLSVSEADTTIAFPGQFGLFDRFDDNSDILVQLQKGLPERTTASVTVAAVDRSYVNWIRGGNFNPSGAVRVPSLLGDGTGVFAALVREFLFIEVRDPTSGIPRCTVP